LVVLQSHVNDPGEECPCGKYNGPPPKSDAKLCDHPRGSTTLKHDVINRLLKQGQIRLTFQAGANCAAIENSIGLGSRRAYRWALRGVESTKLDPGLVGCECHRPAQGIDLFHQVTLADASDGRIAGHLAQGFDAVREEEGAAARARRRKRSLRAGVTAAYNDDIELRWKLHAAYFEGGGMIRECST
jgi:hypothetical protein